MEKILLYVDAENVNACEMDYWVRKLREDNEGKLVIGKFYGSSKVLAKMINIGCALGLQYIDTAPLNNNHKNIADMKIVVDCIDDVGFIYTDGVKEVAILTKDCDFLPLVYKLKSHSIPVNMPLFNSQQRSLTLGDLHQRLIEIGFNPLINGVHALESQYGNLRKILSNDFADGLIEQHLERKKVKFGRVIRTFCDSAEVDRLMQVPAKEFSFGSVLEHVHADANVLLDYYTIKFYGYSFRQKEIPEILQEYIDRHMDE